MTNVYSQAVIASYSINLKNAIGIELRTFNLSFTTPQLTSCIYGGGGGSLCNIIYMDGLVWPSNALK